ncbi:MAG: Asp-tRNA(Asn)/Glu-tRNA(Gln) amidotransferase subunit GatC [Rickettsiales bacterium]|jgi:aspartyl-tRNA(Asn)/glutamyl-tRNA(Gln) amidotransferase subunit C|nr:Asp-tRNA(Asn)/Glu-tRNA(Gln) amidotransferase subunit GatC [Rickettsiales bacterium]
MAFTKQELQKFAHLVRIRVSDDELEYMQIGGILNWLDKLQKIDTSGVLPMLTPADHELPLREDVVMPDCSREELLDNSPDKNAASLGYFAVPKVIEETS